MLRPLLIAVVVATFLLAGCSPHPEITIHSSEPVTIPVEIADTDKERRQGLMFRSSLDGGMLFVFDGEQPLLFWMKDTLIPLDMIFLGSNGTIVTVVEAAEPCSQEPCALYRSIRPAQYVLEVPAGFAAQHRITAGQQASLPGPYYAKT